MNRWTRANPLMSVPGYKVPRGHFANGYTNGGDRVGFRKGRSVRDTTRNPHKDSPSTKPRRPLREKLPDSAYWRKAAAQGGRIGLKRGGGRTKRQAAASEIFKAKGLKKAGEIGPGWNHPLNPLRIIASGRSTNFSGYPEKSKYEKSLEKHKKKFPKLTKDIEYNRSKFVRGWEEGPKKVKPSPQKRADGGRIGLKKGSNKNWIQKAVNPKHKGFCTPMTKKTCTPRRKALARTFKKMGKARKGKA